MEVKHTVFDPRRLKLDRSTHRPGGFFDLPAHTRSTPPSRDGFPRPGSRGDTGARRLKPIPESAQSEAGDRTVALRSNRCVEIRVQGRVWAIQPKYLMIMQSPPSQTPGVEGPRADATELPRFNAARRNAVPRGEDLALSKLAVPRAPLAFGAVYEYRDACGTAKVVASTATMPEKQYALDQRHYEHRLPKRDPQLVWVGLTGGRGGLNEAEMASVAVGAEGQCLSWGDDSKIQLGLGDTRSAVGEERPSSGSRGFLRQRQTGEAGSLNHFDGKKK
eukprot:g22617.t1